MNKISKYDSVFSLDENITVTLDKKIETKTNKIPSSEQLLNNDSFVITLQRNSVRFDYTKKLLNNAGFKNVHAFEAIDGFSSKQGEGDWYKRFNPWSRLFGTKKKFNGQMGCLASHITIWAWLSMSNAEGLMIFEDDALPRPDFKEILPKYLNELRQDFKEECRKYFTSVVDIDLILLGSQVDASENSYYCNKAGNCTHAYYITKDGAKKMMKAVEAVFSSGMRKDVSPIDCIISKASRNGLIRAVSLLGKKIEIDPKYNFNKSTSWNGRDSGIIYQNTDLGSNIHGITTAECKQSDNNIFTVNEETGLGEINE